MPLTTKWSLQLLRKVFHYTGHLIGPTADRSLPLHQEKSVKRPFSRRMWVIDSTNCPTLNSSHAQRHENTRLEYICTWNVLIHWKNPCLSYSHQLFIQFTHSLPPSHTHFVTVETFFFKSCTWCICNWLRVQFQGSFGGCGNTGWENVQHI